MLPLRTFSQEFLTLINMLKMTVALLLLCVEGENIFEKTLADSAFYKFILTVVVFWSVEGFRPRTISLCEL